MGSIPWYWLLIIIGIHKLACCNPGIAGYQQFVIPYVSGKEPRVNWSPFIWQTSSENQWEWQSDIAIHASLSVFCSKTLMIWSNTCFDIHKRLETIYNNLTYESQMTGWQKHPLNICCKSWKKPNFTWQNPRQMGLVAITHTIQRATVLRWRCWRQTANRLNQIGPWLKQ